MDFHYRSRVFIIAMFAALASLLQLIEVFIVMPVPFFKIGLANSIILFFLMKREYLISFMISMIRILIGSFYAGRLFSLPFLFSVSGAAGSFFVMLLVFLLFKKKVSPVSLSIIGAFTHNYMQYFIFTLFFGDLVLFNSFTSLLVGLSIPAGVITGYTALKMGESKLLKYKYS